MQSYQLLFIFVINIYCGQFYRSLSIATPISNLSNVAISPNNDNIVISSDDGILTLYNISGHYKKTFYGQNSSLIGLFWNKNYLISVDQNGNIVTRYSNDINTIRSVRSLGMNALNVDANEQFIGINYGNRLYIYNNSRLQYVNTLYPNQKQKYIFSFAFKKDDQNGLYTIEQNYIVNYNLSPKIDKLIISLANSKKSIIHTHPKQSNKYIIFNSINSSFYQRIQNQIVNLYSIFFKIVSAIYSSTGSYIFVLDQLNIITVFKDGQVLQKIINDIQCNITGITVNLQILAFVDSCGFLHIFTQQQQNTISFWYFIYIGLFITFIFVCVYCIIIKIRKRRKLKLSGSRLNGIEHSLQRQIRKDAPYYDPDAQYHQKFRRSSEIYQPPNI